MSITHLDDTAALDALVAEHANTLLHRSRMSGRALALALGVSPSTLAGKLRGSTWTLAEVVALCGYFDVTLDEITTALPPLAEWQRRWNDLRARRDSNPKPSDP